MKTTQEWSVSKPQPDLREHNDTEMLQEARMPLSWPLSQPATVVFGNGGWGGERQKKAVYRVAFCLLGQLNNQHSKNSKWERPQHIYPSGSEGTRNTSHTSHLH